MAARGGRAILQLWSVIAGGGIAEGANHARKQLARAGYVSGSERIALSWGIEALGIDIRVAIRACGPGSRSGGPREAQSAFNAACTAAAPGLPLVVVTPWSVVSTQDGLAFSQAVATSEADWCCT